MIGPFNCDFAISFAASICSPSFLDPGTLHRVATSARIALGFCPDHPEAPGAVRLVMASEVLLK